MRPAPGRARSEGSGDTVKAILIALGIVAVPDSLFLAAVWNNDNDTLSGKLGMTGLIACATMVALAFIISAISAISEAEKDIALMESWSREYTPGNKPASQLKPPPPPFRGASGKVMD